MRPISREFSRNVDRRACEEFRIPSICLMENAGAGAAAVARGLLAEPAASVVCVCGPGNNGGDGLVVARHLAIAGHPVRVLLLASRSGAGPQGDAAVQLAIVQAMGLPLERVSDTDPLTAARSGMAGADLLVDGLFGTGLESGLRGTAADLVEALNRSPSRVLALDVPSGLDCDTGRPLGPCVRASVTVTFVAPKLGFDAPGASDWVGEVRVVGIGAPAQWPAG